MSSWPIRGPASGELTAWLDLATQGLEARAAARIRREYTDHFEDASAAGQTEAEFVAGLGRAQAAQAAFFRTHLNVNQLWFGAPNGPLAWRWLAVFGALGLLNTGLVYSDSPVSSVAVGGLFLAGIGLRLWVGSRLRRRRLTRLQGGAVCSNAGSVLLAVATGLTVNSWMFVWFAAAALCSSLALWRKLRQDDGRAA